MSKKYICIHAHFYQPPRDNPWLEFVEREPSASPFHNWNERITAECYGPNCASPILENGKVTRIVNNYQKISFNFGPTLLSWLEKHEPEVYGEIIESDHASASERGGHGNAIAQVYNHSIMPLNGTLDKETQVVWGIRDFERRFKRKPEGIWLAETAVDSETLEIAARHGIKFTILAPHQALRVRPVKDGDAKDDDAWKETNGGVDTGRPYLFRTGAASDIAIFFYDGALSNSIAFAGALNDGRKLSESLVNGFSGDSSAGLVHIATDGESYGHHHKFGDMALAAMLDTLENNDKIRLVNYGQFLEMHPPEMEVEINEESSWSCAHGIERWRSDCGCQTGGDHGWNQKWRAPLRRSLNRLKERLDRIFEEEAARYVGSPWVARNDYINMILDRSESEITAFFGKHSRSSLTADQTKSALKLFEMQRMAMTMFTSCGWFFNDLSGLETVQILKYAARAVSLAEEFTNGSLEREFLDDLSGAISNKKKYGSAADIYETQVLPLKLNPKRVVAHQVIINSLREEPVLTEGLYSFTVEVLDNSKEEYLDRLIMTGRLKLKSTLSLESWDMMYCLVHFGAHDFNCAVKPYTENAGYMQMKNELLEAFRSNAAPKIIDAMGSHFGKEYYGLKALFDSERGGVMLRLMEKRIHEFEKAYISVFEKNVNLVNLFLDTGVEVPYEIKLAAKYTLEKQLSGLFDSGDYSKDMETMEEVLNRAEKLGIELYTGPVKRKIFSFLERHMKELCRDGDCECVKIVLDVMTVLKRLGIDIDAWRLQRILFPYFTAAKNPDDPLNQRVNVTDDFKVLFEIFNFRV